MYQVHYTFNQNLISKNVAEKLLYCNKNVKVLEHYNITSSGVKHYELLTKENVESIAEATSIPHSTISYKVETFKKPKDFLYVERHYKFPKKPNSILFTSIDKNLMMAKVVNPVSHKYIATIRAKTVERLEELANRYFEPNDKYTEEFCIVDTNEALDYLHA